MDEFEASVRRALQAPYRDEPVDANDFLAGVHRGARVRRTRQVVGGVAISVAMVTTGVYVGAASGVFGESSVPVAGETTDSPDPEVGVPQLYLETSASGSASAGSSLPSASILASTSVPPGVVSPTADSASTPQISPSPPTANSDSAQALSLSATGTQHQWVLLAVPGGNCPEQQCAVVEMTDDAGKSWEPLSATDVGVSARPADDTVREVRFAGDGTNGWTFGGELLATHDAGASWTTPALPVSGSVTSLEAWGDFVYAVISDDQRGSVSLVRSPVGYDDWQLVNLGMDPYSISSLVASERVVALLARPMNSDVGNLLLTSTDGGSWITHQPCTDGPYPTTLSTTENSLWVMCSDDSTSVARVSLDDGQTWTDAAGEFPPGSQLAARDATTAVVAGPAGDGITLVGVDREPLEVSDADLMDVELAGFTNPTTGYVLDADGQVLRTDDGGRTWQPYSLPR